MHLFYTPDITGDHYTLNEEESRHCLKVLRLKTGDKIHLTDGKGNLWEAEIIGEFKKQCTVRLNRNQQTKAYGSRPYYLHIAIAPTKNTERFEWFLEKATEIGIDEITPLICQHSERRHLRTDRLEKIITAALKQSLKAWHPVLNQPEPMEKFLKREFDATKFLARDQENAPGLNHIYIGGENAVILIGPEGDFSDEETEQAVKSGFQVVSLGSSRFRTETAGVLACHTIYLKNAE